MASVEDFGVVVEWTDPSGAKQSGLLHVSEMRAPASAAAAEAGADGAGDEGEEGGAAAFFADEGEFTGEQYADVGGVDKPSRYYKVGFALVWFGLGWVGLGWVGWFAGVSAGWGIGGLWGPVSTPGRCDPQNRLPPGQPTNKSTNRTNQAGDAISCFVLSAVGRKVELTQDLESLALDGAVDEEGEAGDEEEARALARLDAAVGLLGGGGARRGGGGLEGGRSSRSEGEAGAVAWALRRRRLPRLA